MGIKLASSGQHPLSPAAERRAAAIGYTENLSKRADLMTRLRARELPGGFDRVEVRTNSAKAVVGGGHRLQQPTL
ncbi:hypothetical protein [Pararobbsia alpina]|uniref:hypothetical protein n=1 Tax=Pararobbsia alpina TaxID=621374 RepID=UPI001582303A|nr:hypothetical protein [Pararobbsia alpina]